MYYEDEEARDGRAKARKLLGLTRRNDWAVLVCRTNITVNPTRVLSGYEAWKYRRKIAWRRLCVQSNEVTSRLVLWGSSFKRIEGVFGNGVSSYFRFLRWLFLLNVTIFLLIMAFLVVPQVALSEISHHDNPSHLASNSSMNVTRAPAENDTMACSTKYTVNVDLSFVQVCLDFVQGTGWMEKTLLFYGVFSKGRLYSGRGGGDSFSYNMPLAYLLVTVVYMATSFYLIIRQTSVCVRDQLIQGFNNQSKARCYSNMTFAGWDFSLTDSVTARMRHASIYCDIRGRLAEERLEARRVARTARQKYRLYAVRLLINLVVVAILASVAYLIYYATEASTTFKDREDYPSHSKLTRLLMEFIPSLTITILNFVIPHIFMKIVIGEQYHPDFEVRITLARTVFLRLASVAVLLATLYYQITCKPLDECLVGLPPACPQLRCWESYVGQNLYRLIIMSFVVSVAAVIVVDTPIRIIGTRCSHRVLKKLCEEQEFTIPKNVLDLVYVQTLCWLGGFFAPLIPAMTTVSFFLLFYLKKATVLYNHTPSTRPYRSSRSHIFFMVVLLTAFILCCVPLGYCIWKVVPSRGCGPFREYGHAYDVMIEAVQSWPGFIQYSFTLMTSTTSFIVLLAVLVLLLHYYRCAAKGRQSVIALLREQISLESRDKQFILARLNELTAAGEAQQVAPPSSSVADDIDLAGTPLAVRPEPFDVDVPMADAESNELVPFTESSST